MHIKEVYSDNEYVIMSEIAENELITQRELSKKLGISVSTVNILVNKMIREGLIKMSQVTQRQVIYMLTPVGMLEKANKTVKYLKGHYRIIYETKEKMKFVFEELIEKYNSIIIWIRDEEMREIIRVSVDETMRDYRESSIEFIDDIDVLKSLNNKETVCVYLTDSYEDIKIIEEVGKISYSLFDYL